MRLLLSLAENVGRIDLQYSKASKQKGKLCAKWLNEVKKFIVLLKSHLQEFAHEPAVHLKIN